MASHKKRQQSLSIPCVSPTATDSAQALPHVTMNICLEHPIPWFQAGNIIVLPSLLSECLWSSMNHCKPSGHQSATPITVISVTLREIEYHRTRSSCATHQKDSPHIPIQCRTSGKSHRSPFHRHPSIQKPPVRTFLPSQVIQPIPPQHHNFLNKPSDLSPLSYKCLRNTPSARFDPIHPT